MIEFFCENWSFVLVIMIIVASNALNLTLFKDIDVSPIKDHIEEGWSRANDEATNESQKSRREVSTRLMWFLCSIVLILSIIF